jgi:far upstream element-binding protein
MSDSDVDAMAKARQIAAQLSANAEGTNDNNLGKRKSRWDNDNDNLPPSSIAATSSSNYYGPSSTTTSSSAGLGSMKSLKINVPVNEYPDINFLGLLIGPKGATQKHIQVISGAKILLRGKGAKGGNGGPEDDEDLHVIIEGNDDSIEKAKIEIEKILFNPKEALKLKSDQLSKLAEERSGISSYQPAPFSSLVSGGSSLQINEDLTTEMRIPNQVVGYIIGKQGDNLQRMQIQTGARLLIQKESEMAPGETTRLLTLKGPTTSHINSLKMKIDEIVNNKLNNMNSSNTNNSSSMSSSNNSTELPHPFVIKIPVPNDKVGLIIGKGGLNVKGISERTRTKIFIPQGPDEDNPQIRTISIGADIKEAAEAAQLEIFLIVQQQQASLQQPNNGANIMYLVVPDDKVGVIIGKGGSTVKDIMSRTNIKIIIPQVADPGSNPAVRTLSLIGNNEGQQLARFEIEMILQGSAAGQTTQAAQAAAAATNAAIQASQYQHQQQNMMYGGYYNNNYNYYNNEAAMNSNNNIDPTSYYNDFWTYASYAGEAAARAYYTTWSPPVGTLPPNGIVIPNDNNNNNIGNNYEVEVVASNISNVSSTEDTYEKQREEYEKQYREWYEAHGKAQGADPNPPQ